MATEKTHRGVISPKFVSFCICTFEAVDIFARRAILQHVWLARFKEMRSVRIFELMLRFKINLRI